MDIRKPQLVKVEAFVIVVGSSATPSKDSYIDPEHRIIPFEL